MTDKPRKPLKRAEWRRTPYAASRVEDEEGAISKLLARYGVSTNVMMANYNGQSGRPAFGVRFVLRGRAYRIAFESLDTDATVKPEELRKQVKRAVFHTLKALLETATVFATAEQILFAFAEVPSTGQTIYDMAAPSFDKLGPTNLGALLLGPAPTQPTT